MARTTRRQALAAGTAPTPTTPAATRLALIADKMQELKESMDGLPDDAWNDVEHGIGTTLNMEWHGLYAEASRLPIATPADLIALARISQNIRDSIRDDTNEEIELIRSKIDAAIIGGMLPAEASRDLDAAIYAACDALHRLKAERDACPSDNHGGDDLFDRLVGDFDKKLLALVKMPARTVDGWRAQAALVLPEMQKGMELIAQAFLRQFIGKASARKCNNPDAALIAACDTLRQVVAELDACAGSTDDDVIDALADKEAAAALALASMTAMTHAGLQVQADLLLANMVSTHEVAVRAFLAGLGGGSPAMLPGNPDAAYIALCEEILAAWTEYDRLIATDAEESITTATHRQAGDGFDRLMAMPLPVTAAGRKAAARVALVHVSSAASHEPLDIDMNHVGERLAWLLVGQLAGREEAVATGLALRDRERGVS